MAAVSARRLDVLNLLMKAPELDLERVDSRKFTALHVCAAAGWEEGLLILLKVGANRGAKNIAGLTPAAVAAGQGRHSAVVILEADPAKMTIHEACSKGLHQHVMALFKQGCPYNYTEEDGITPLMSACRGGQIDVVRILIRIRDVQQGVNLRCALKGMTALMYAAAHGYTDVTFLLLGHGAEKGLKDAQGLTAQGHAQRHGVATLVAYMSQQIVV